MTLNNGPIRVLSRICAWKVKSCHNLARRMIQYQQYYITHFRAIAQIIQMLTARTLTTSESSTIGKVDSGKT